MSLRPEGSDERRARPERSARYTQATMCIVQNRVGCARPHAHHSSRRKRDGRAKDRFGPAPSLSLSDLEMIRVERRLSVSAFRASTETARCSNKDSLEVRLELQKGMYWVHSLVLASLQRDKDPSKCFTWPPSDQKQAQVPAFLLFAVMGTSLQRS